jgi:hypothetical protein
VLNRHLSLDLTTNTPQQTVISSFVRASLPNRRKSKQQNNG